ncbi:hypothetical protein C1646_692641, partial [Rhizophagus diaphanus]
TWFNSHSNINNSVTSKTYEIDEKHSDHVISALRVFVILFLQYNFRHNINQVQMKCSESTSTCHAHSN